MGLLSKYFRDLSYFCIFHKKRAQNVDLVYDFHETSIPYIKDKTRPDKEVFIMKETILEESRISSFFFLLTS